MCSPVALPQHVTLDRVPCPHGQYHARATFRAGRLLPGVTPCRPLNRTLVAQRITQPQMYSMLVVVALHIPTCALLILKLQLGPAAGAWAICIANLNNAVLQTSYIAWAGLQSRVWGRPCRSALQVGLQHMPRPAWVPYLN